MSSCFGQPALPMEIWSHIIDRIKSITSMIALAKVSLSITVQQLSMFVLPFPRSLDDTTFW